MSPYFYEDVASKGLNVPFHLAFGIDFRCEKRQQNKKNIEEIYQVNTDKRAGL
ncbi:8548_t:CDS:2 [Ambispora leptoticha]|uniref:8548_t:CDS:1 n=1 Tax=Ambispora leptoticha TaxID=144679 RepID=A0A9N9EDG7_9GLOM|nr:8548_t:CDS:2 [Ambispora leptoticha]